MTDTQEAMREEFEALGLFNTTPTYKEIAWEGYKAHAAQSAEKIARLEAEVEKERKFHIMEQEMRIAEERKLAAAKLSNKQLRETLIKCLPYIRLNPALSLIAQEVIESESNKA